MFSMETLEIIRSQAITQSYNSSIHKELNSILLKLESKTLEEFLNGEKSEEIRAIDNEIRNIVTSNVHSIRNESEDKIAIDVLRRSSNACTSVTSSMSDHRPSSVLTPTPQACNLSLCEFAVSLQDHFT